eukprot:4461068-Prymnesium_polylepis.1
MCIRDRDKADDREPCAAWSDRRTSYLGTGHSMDHGLSFSVCHLHKCVRAGSGYKCSAPVRPAPPWAWAQ